MEARETSATAQGSARGWRFRFGLKTFLIVLTLAGSLLGVGGRLWTQRPELLLQLLSYSPFAFSLAGLLALGVASRRRSISCSKVFGAALLMLFFGFVLSVVLPPQRDRRARLRMLPAKYLLGVKASKDETDVWQEVERRIYARSIAKSALNEAIGRMVEEQEVGRTASWRGAQVFSKAFELGQVDAELVLRAADQRFGKPRTTPLRLREGKSQFPISVAMRYDHVGSNVLFCPCDLIWKVDSVWLGGKELSVETKRSKIAMRTGIHVDLPPGEYQLEVNLQCGYQASAHIGRGMQLHPREPWPQTLREWEQRVLIPITVYSADATIVRLRDVEKDDPTKLIRFRNLTHLRIGPNVRNMKWMLQAKVDIDTPHRLGVAMSYDIFVVLPDRRIPAGSLVAYRTKTESAFHQEWSEAPDDFDQASLDRGDLEFVPNPSHVELGTQISEICGKGFVLEDVFLGRRPRKKTPANIFPSDQPGS